MNTPPASQDPIKNRGSPPAAPTHFEIRRRINFWREKDNNLHVLDVHMILRIQHVIVFIRAHTLCVCLEHVFSFLCKGPKFLFLEISKEIEAFGEDPFFCGVFNIR